MSGKLWISTSVAALLWCGAAHAQQAQPTAPEDQATTLGDVVVTAERRTTNLQTTAVAASVMSGEELQAKGVTNIETLQFSMPSVTVQNSGQGNSFNVRGIGKTENSSSIGVGVITYRDGVAVFPAYFQNEPFFDIQSLELLRGPQGTFAGQNATGGAVFITEKNPDFGGLGGYVTAQYGNYNDVRLQGAINLPLTDTLAARLAFNSENRDSFYDVIGTPSRGRPGVLDSKSVRGSLLWTPNDQLRVLLKSDYTINDMGGYPASPYNSTLPLHTIATNGPYAAKDETARTVLNVSYEFANGITLRSISGAQYGTTMVRSDLDGTATLPFTFYDKVEQRLLSQEFTLVSPDDGRLKWVVGAYYQDDLITFPPGQFVTTQYVAPTLPILYDTILDGENPKTTAAGFGQISYDLTDALELQVGGRYTRSTVENNAKFAAPLLGLALVQNDRYEEDAFTGKIALNWTLDDNNFLYAFYARGHKAGGLNGPNLAFVAPKPFDGEDVDDFEAGWKATLFDGHVRTQLGAYYDIYKNFQIIIGDPTTASITSILNVTGDTKIYGLEASAQGRFGGFGFDAGLSLAHSELGTFYGADPRRARTGACDQNTGPASGNCVNLEGNAQTYAPELTVSLGAEYAFQIGNATLTPRIDYSHISETWTTIFANEALGDKLKARDIVNAQLTYDTGDWRLQAYSTNLGDLEYIASIKAGLRYAGAPRQYGVRLTKNF
ncbi:TonB-dependent receptor [Brevundimonas goettingensis]|uniref:TonB-dependent receptor n=1 Tax=Brevundimonas goettingensis TaxID=2774190 RepID=A0A975BYG6_9CAUL|nr:TonB-dependent receptor [Brevundimonas goettingensis]QTC89911.1 TonB-dependent receptor [Brevundimonas goettingensis]